MIKDYCVSCSEKIKDSDPAVRYNMYGNYCADCVRKVDKRRVQPKEVINSISIPE